MSVFLCVTVSLCLILISSGVPHVLLLVSKRSLTYSYEHRLQHHETVNTGTHASLCSTARRTETPPHMLAGKLLKDLMKLTNWTSDRSPSQYGISEPRLPLQRGWFSHVLTGFSQTFLSTYDGQRNSQSVWCLEASPLRSPGRVRHVKGKEVPLAHHLPHSLRPPSLDRQRVRCLRAAPPCCCHDGQGRLGAPQYFHDPAWPRVT